MAAGLSSRFDPCGEEGTGETVREAAHIVSVSGGKDSTATALLAKGAHENVRYVFADTGNEHPLTYEYLDYLRGVLGPIDVVKAEFSQQIARKRKYIDEHWPEPIRSRAMEIMVPTGIPYLDLCLWKTRFPSRMAQFCTSELKIFPLVEYQDAFSDSCEFVVSWQGVRRDESPNRRNALDIEHVGDGLWIYRPIASWTAQQVIDYVQSHGVALNPLYSQGMSRVGCMPCINANKAEIKEISVRFPEEIKRIAEWERLVGLASRREQATFFTNNPPQDIYQVIEWSKTARGGKQHDFYFSESCSSSYGLCE
ncbi:MAG: phosphoadenosine phosphosulfate reductase domain-containing protein [Acidobacteriaceae bacterium]